MNILPKIANSIILAISILLIFTFPSCKSNEHVKNKADLIDEFLTGQAQLYKFNGNVLVAEKGEIVFQKSYGYADIDSKRMLNDSSVFELASVSKQFTAAAILLLVDKAKLKLTDSLRQFFPELPYTNITIHHLLTHTSGLPDYMDIMMEKWDKSKIAFNNDVITLLAQEKPEVYFNPGEKWEYSNTAYVLLASIVEKISGQNYKDYMAENIFTPLSMYKSRIYNTRRSLKDTIANYAYGYIYNDSLGKYILPDNFSQTKMVVFLDGIQGDGIVNSTTGDLLKWDRSLKNQTLLKVNTHNEMLKGHALSDSLNMAYYGYGVAISKSDPGNFISHSGGWPGYTTYLSRNTDKDQTFIVLSNNNSNAPSIGITLQHIMADIEVVMPSKHIEINVDTVTLKSLTGLYKGKFDIRFESDSTGLKMLLSNGQIRILKPESSHKFFYADGSDRQVEFIKDSTENVISVILINNGVKSELKRVN